MTSGWSWRTPRERTWVDPSCAKAIFSVSYMLGPNQGLILGAFISSLSWERSVSYSSSRELGPDSPTTRLALGHSLRGVALLTSHNRCEATIACLQSYYSQRLPPSIVLEAVLVDDRSVDDTEQLVRRTFPAVSVISGTGALYWAGGMAHGRKHGYDFERGLSSLGGPEPRNSQSRCLLADLLSTERQVGAGRCIVVGAVRDPESGELTYSGLRRQGRGLHPLRVEMVHPTGGVEPVEMFHGNVVLVVDPCSNGGWADRWRIFRREGRRRPTETVPATSESRASSPPSQSGHVGATAPVRRGSTRRCQLRDVYRSFSDGRDFLRAQLPDTLDVTAASCGPSFGWHHTFGRPSH